MRIVPLIRPAPLVCHGTSLVPKCVKEVSKGEMLLRTATKVPDVRSGRGAMEVAVWGRCSRGVW